MYEMYKQTRRNTFNSSLRRRSGPIGSITREEAARWLLGLRITELPLLLLQCRIRCDGVKESEEYRTCSCWWCSPPDLLPLFWNGGLRAVSTLAGGNWKMLAVDRFWSQRLGSRKDALKSSEKTIDCLKIKKLRLLGSCSKFQETLPN